MSEFYPVTMEYTPDYSGVNINVGNISSGVINAYDDSVAIFLSGFPFESIFLFHCKESLETLQLITLRYRNKQDVRNYPYFIFALIMEDPID